MEKQIATIEKNTTEQIHVDLSEYRGATLVALRVYYNASVTGQDWRPTKKGITCRLDKLVPIIDALKQAEAEVREAGLLPE